MTKPIDKLREALAKMTPGPWAKHRWRWAPATTVVGSESRVIYADQDRGRGSDQGQAKHDAEGIVALVNKADMLLGYVGLLEWARGEGCDCDFVPDPGEDTMRIEDACEACQKVADFRKQHGWDE